MTVEIVNPPELPQPRGFSHGVVSPAGARVVCVAGQTAADAGGEVADGDFSAQFALALTRVVRVVQAAGGRPDSILRMTIYVTDLAAYRAARERLAEVWRAQMGRHYPAVALVQVTGLVDRGATVEIQADAVVS